MIKSYEQDGVCQAVAGVELTIYHAAEIAVQLRQMIQDYSDICLDLSAVQEIDTAGLQLLVQAVRICAAQDKLLQLTCPSPAIQDVVGLLRLSELLGFDPVEGRRTA